MLRHPGFCRTVLMGELIAPFELPKRFRSSNPVNTACLIRLDNYRYVSNPRSTLKGTIGRTYSKSITVRMTAKAFSTRSS